MPTGTSSLVWLPNGEAVIGLRVPPADRRGRIPGTPIDLAEGDYRALQSELGALWGLDDDGMGFIDPAILAYRQWMFDNQFKRIEPHRLPHHVGYHVLLAGLFSHLLRPNPAAEPGLVSGFVQHFPPSRLSTPLRGAASDALADVTNQLGEYGHRLGLGPFNHTDANVQAWAGQHALELVHDFTAQQTANVTSVIHSALAGQIPHDLVAPQIEAVIHLHPQQAQWVTNMVSRLTQQGLSPGEVARQSRAYANRLKAQRALTIARTEVMRAQNYGALDGWLQAQQAGWLGPDAEKMWIVGPGACPTCASVHGTRVLIDQPFPYPGRVDVYMPPGHPNCRCTAGLTTGHMPVPQATMDALAKHLPGGHDQKAHGRRGGGGGGKPEYDRPTANIRDDRAKSQLETLFNYTLPSGWQAKVTSVDNWRRPLDGEQQTTVNVDVYRADQKGGGRGHVEFTTGKDGTYIALVDLRDGPRAEGGTHHNTGHGLGRSILKAVAQATMDTPGVRNRLKLEADIDVGGYAWARMGFTPSKAQWGKMRKQLRADMGVWYDPDGRQSSPDRVREKAGERFRSHDSATMNWLLRRTRWDDGPGSMPGAGNPTSRIRDFDSQADFRTMLAFLDADTKPSAIGPFAASPAGRLLLGTDWDGSVSLKGQGSDAFWSYVDRVSKAASVPGEASQTPSDGRDRSSGVFLSSAGELGTTDALSHGEILGENLLESVPFARLLRAMRHHDEIGKALGPVVRDIDHVPTGYLDEVLTEIEKHLPGRHDQKSHGRRGGGAVQQEFPGMPKPNPDAGRERRARLDATPTVREIREREAEEPGSIMYDEWGGEMADEIVRENWSTWSECRSIRQAAYQIVGLDIPQLPSDSPADPGVTSSAAQAGGWTSAPDPTRAEFQRDAYVLLSAVHETPAWSDTLYRGVDLSTSSTIAIQALEGMKPGDTFDMPLASFTDDRSQAVRFMDADSWGESSPSFKEAARTRASMSPTDSGPEQVMFTLEKGAKAIAGDQISSPRYLSRSEVQDVAWRYEEAGHDRPKVGDFILEDVDPDGYYDWFDSDRGPHEYISGGRFQVVSVRRHPDGPLMVRLRQLGTFNPDDGTFHPIVKGMADSATHAALDACFDFPLAPRHDRPVAKHLPGAHDQRTHGHRGHAGGSPMERLSRALPQADLSGLSGQDVPMSRTGLTSNKVLANDPNVSFTPAHGLRAYFHEGSAKGTLHVTPTADELAAVAATVEGMSADQRRAIQAVSFDTRGRKGTMLVDLLRWRLHRANLAALDLSDPEVRTALDEARDLGFPEPNADLTYQVAKHLPGRHDQKSHGHRGGGRVAEAVADTVSESGALRLLTAAYDDRPRTPPHMSIKRAEAEVAKVIDPNGYVDLGLLDPALAGEVAMAFTDFAKEHPEAARHISVVGLYKSVPARDGSSQTLLGPGRYAVTHEVMGRDGKASVGVALNPDLFKPGGKGQEHLMHSRLTGHIVSSSVYGTLQHEFGHVLDQHKFHQAHPEGAGHDKTRHYIYDTKQHLGLPSLMARLPSDRFPDDATPLSDYAHQSWSELIAEARTRRVLHGDNWAETWPTLDELLRRLEADQ